MSCICDKCQAEAERQADLSGRPPHEPLSQTDRDSILELRTAGQSLGQIARQYGISREWVRKLCLKG